MWLRQTTLLTFFLVQGFDPTRIRDTNHVAAGWMFLFLQKIAMVEILLVGQGVIKTTTMSQTLLELFTRNVQTHATFCLVGTSYYLLVP